MGQTKNLINTGRLKMSSTVVIYLDFECDGDNINDSDVYSYLNELMENKSLDWEIGESFFL